MDEEEGHLNLRDPAAQALPNSPAEAQVAEVSEVPVSIQPSGGVKFAGIEEEGGVSAQGISSHLYQCLRTTSAAV